MFEVAFTLMKFVDGFGKISIPAKISSSIDVIELGNKTALITCTIPLSASTSGKLTDASLILTPSVKSTVTLSPDNKVGTICPSVNSPEPTTPSTT